MVLMPSYGSRAAVIGICVAPTVSVPVRVSGPRRPACNVMVTTWPVALRPSTRVQRPLLSNFPSSGHARPDSVSAPVKVPLGVMLSLMKPPLFAPAAPLGRRALYGPRIEANDAPTVRLAGSLVALPSRLV